MGWYSENYGGLSTDDKLSIQPDGLKRPWQLHNTMKLDAIRSEIDEISSNEIEKSILLTSLILGMDKVDNTVGHQVSYVKKWSDRSYNTLKLEKPKLIIGDQNYNVYQKNIFDIDNYYDLVYLDPPFFTQKTHSLSTRDNSIEFSFEDKWSSLNEYLGFMEGVLSQCQRVLKSTGSIFLHCDKSASHHLRVLLEKVFGEENFQSEIIWSYKRWSNSKKGLLNSQKLLGRQYIGIDVSKDAVELSNKRLVELTKSESQLLAIGEEGYLDKSDYERAILKEIEAIPVERNGGIDGFLKSYIDGYPVSVRIQKQAESLEIAKRKLMNASKTKNCKLMILIKTQTEPDNTLFNWSDENVLVIDSYDLQIKSWTDGQDQTGKAFPFPKSIIRR